MDEIYDSIIIGSGAAGLAASLYAGRYTMKVLTLGKEFGGETATAGIIHNYPGVPDIEGYELMKIMRKQAEALGVKVLEGEVTDITKDDSGCFSVHLEEKIHQSASVIFAHGTQRRHLGIPNEKELTGKGIHYCITCDGPLYSGKTIAIVGGGDASVKGANLAAEYAEKIYLITLEKDVRAEPINYDLMKKHGDKVVIISENTVSEIVGNGTLEKVVLKNEFNGSRDLLVTGLFVEIGAVPDAVLPQKLGVALDERGYVAVDNMMKTNISGVFAAGDIVNHFGSFKQDITAAAMGAVAATSAYDYRKKNGDVCVLHGIPHGGGAGAS